MKSCPYCKEGLNRNLVDSRRTDGKKWYQLSSESSPEKYCGLCGEKLAIEQTNRWYYNLTSPLLALTYFVAIFLGQELSVMLKIVLVALFLVGTVLLIKQMSDFRYITFEKQKKKKIQSAIKHANGHFENPIELGEYCAKYSFTKQEINKRISLGLIEAYAIDGVDFLNDNAPNNET